MAVPLPAGAATKTESSEPYTAWNVWVWIGLSSEMPSPAMTASNCLFFRAATGSGCKSSSSVGGAYFSGRMRCLKESGSVASQPSHLSEMTRTKYCGGSGSVMGRVNVMIESSSHLARVSRKPSWWMMISESASSTMTMKGSA